MANNNYISRSKFQEVFAKALSKCNVLQDEQASRVMEKIKKYSY